MSVLLLTNPYAQPPQQQTGLGMAMSMEMAGAVTAQAVTPMQSMTETRSNGSSTAYDGKGAGAGGAAANQQLDRSKRPERPTDATPRSVVDAQAEAESAALPDDPAQQSIKAQPPAEPPEIIDMAEQTRQRAQKMPLPLPTMPFLEQT